MRYSKTTWKLEVTNGNKYLMEYHIAENRMTTNAGELEKSVGWPTYRMGIHDMIQETRLKVDKKKERFECKNI